MQTAGRLAAALKLRYKLSQFAKLYLRLSFRESEKKSVFTRTAGIITKIIYSGSNAHIY